MVSLYVQRSLAWVYDEADKADGKQRGGNNSSSHFGMENSGVEEHGCGRQAMDRQ